MVAFGVKMDRVLGRRGGEFAGFKDGAFVLLGELLIEGEKVLLDLFRPFEPFGDLGAEGEGGEEEDGRGSSIGVASGLLDDVDELLHPRSDIGGAKRKTLLHVTCPQHQDHEVERGMRGEAWLEVPFAVFRGTVDGVVEGGGAARESFFDDAEIFP